MSILTDSTGNLYRPYSHPLEKDFERTVIRLADQIFGSSSIYVDVKKQVKGEIVTIPDGYVIDMAEPNDPKLFIIENEISIHDAFRHVGIQLLKFVTSFEDAKTSVRRFLMEEISAHSEQMQKLQDSCGESNSRNVDAYMDKAVYGDFKGIVLIDEATSELHRVLKNIRANISVLEVKTYVSDSGEYMHQFDTLYDEYDDTTGGVTKGVPPDVRAVRRARRAASDTIVVPAREEGFKRAFLGENHWYAIRIGAAMKEKIRYIAAYQVAPVSAITHIAEIEDIVPYKDTGKYEVIFKSPAVEIPEVRLKNPSKSPPRTRLLQTRSSTKGKNHRGSFFLRLIFAFPPTAEIRNERERGYNGLDASLLLIVANTLLSSEPQGIELAPIA